MSAAVVSQDAPMDSPIGPPRNLDNSLRVALTLTLDDQARNGRQQREAEGPQPREVTSIAIGTSHARPVQAPAATMTAPRPSRSRSGPSGWPSS